MQSVNHYVGLDGIHSKAKAIWQEKTLCFCPSLQITINEEIY